MGDGLSLMPRVEIHRAVKDFKCWIIAGSRAVLERELASHAEYEPDERDRWTFEVEVANLDSTGGEYFVLHDENGTPYPHVAWLCPYCKKKHTTDVDPLECSPSLWLCEIGLGRQPVLVEWQSPT
jgi:hypothetical protein